MELDNQTPVPAVLWRTILDQERIAAAVLARVTYRVVDRRLLLDPNQAWILDKTQYESPIGPRPPEDCFRRGGVDLLILGSARAPGGIPTPKVEVRFVVGSFVGGVDVHGERVWSTGFGAQLHATPPKPFVERPLSLACAFGGTQLWDGLEVPHPLNPEGKGYYIEERAAREQPLANIEDPRRPVRQWHDHVDPVGVGFCPRGFGPRIQRSVSFDTRGILTKLDAGFFNDAFPDMVAPEPEPGTLCQVHGVREQGALGFLIPRLPLSARIRIGDTIVDRDLRIDQIGVEPDLERVFITYRFPFRYTVVSMQPRACELRWSPRAHEG
jgi:hypothetical protein